jgi:hypothetical protein
MSMMIAQNGPGITNFVTVKTAYWNQHTGAAGSHRKRQNKTIGQGWFSGNGTDEPVQRPLPQQARRARPIAHETLKPA